MDIEKVASETPDKIIKFGVDPLGTLSLQASDAKTVIFCVCLSTSKPKYSSCLIFCPASISSWLTGKPLASVCGVMSCEPNNLSS
jgi:hypothetical protein